MGLWDILVPTEPGVLHNLIANPSFEHNNVTVYGQGGNYVNGETNGLAYWTASSGTTMTRSSTWASQGAYSLKIAAGTVGAEKSVSYNPRSSIIPTPLVGNIAISTANTPPTGYTSTIPNAKAVTIAVMALNDVGMTLANNVSDVQNYHVTSASNTNSRVSYPTIDARRGHTDPVFCSPVTTVSGNSIKVSITDVSTTIESRPRGWAVWYWYNDVVDANRMFVLAAVVPNIYDGATYDPFGSTTVLDILSIILPSRLTIQTGKITKSFSSANTIYGTGTSFANTDVGKNIYILTNENKYHFIGKIKTYVSATEITTEEYPQVFGNILVNSSFYFINETNPQSFDDNTQGGVSSFVYNSSTLIFNNTPIGLNSTAPYFGITNNAYGEFTKKHHLYLDWSLASPNASNPNASYNDTGANWSVYLINNSVSNPSTTLLGTLDVSNVTSAAASRMELRKKFLIDRLSGDTSDMSIKIKYTGGNASTDADLYIDGVQFVDVGMIWRSYDWYNTTVTTYNTPLHFSDWDWDVVEFTYIDGDSPGAIWADTMPTQSGTYIASFPYFTNNGIWHVNPSEYGTVQSAGGYSSPQFRQQSQWRNEAKPVYGISVPGLSQSSLQIQSTSLGFWVSLSTSNVNVVVEPSTSGTGMPEIATTSLEYGIIDGGFVQRQVSRMRTMQFTITISANSWLNLHASRRSFINLLKFDQLAQQGDRMLRYTGGGTPVVTSVTYQSGLEFNGVAQNASFTEAIQLRFLSADPYFYTQTALVQDISPTTFNYYDASHIMYRLGNTAEWLPLSRHYQSGAPEGFSGESPFYNSSMNSFTPADIGWISSPSGNVSAIVVGGRFSYPFSVISFFTVSGFEQKNTSNYAGYTNVTPIASVSITSSTASAIVTANSAVFTSAHVGCLLFNANGSGYIGAIQTVNSSTNVTLTANAATTQVAIFGWNLYQPSTTTNANTPNNVFGRQMFELKTTGDLTPQGGIAETVAIASIYQENSNSVIIVGQFEEVIELGTSTSGSVSTVRSYDNSSAFSKYQYARAVRFTMTETGRVIAQPIDQATAGRPVVIRRSNLYNLLNYTSVVNGYKVNTRIVGMTGTANNTYFFATSATTQQSGNSYDTTYPRVLSRSTSSFAKESVNSSIVYQDNSFDVSFVGIRLTSRVGGTISYSGTAPNSLLITGSGTNFDLTSSSLNLFVYRWQGKSIFTAGGIYIGQIFVVLSSTSLLLCEPPPFTFTNIEFEISLDAYSVITDNRTQKNTIYALLNDTSVPSVDWNTFLWSYINSPIVVGGASILSGSRSIGTPPGLNNVLGIDNSGLIRVDSGSTTVTGSFTNFNTSMINNFILTSTNQIIGKIASVTDKSTLNLYEITVTPLATLTAFVIRPSRFFTNSSGYQTLGGVLLLGNDTVVTSNFPSTSNVGTYNDINPSRSYIDPVISSTTYSLSTPFIFTDTTQSKGFLQTTTNLTGQILRRGAGYLYDSGTDSIGSKLQMPPSPATNGAGYVSNGAIDANLVLGIGTINQAVNDGFITVAVTGGLFQQHDTMRVLYNDTLEYVGVIQVVFSNTSIQLNTVTAALTGTYYLSGVAVMAGAGTITSIGASSPWTVTGVGTAFTALDIGRSLYNYRGQFLGVIKTYTSITSVALNAAPTYAITGGLAYGLSSPLYFYQFDLQTTTNNATAFPLPTYSIGMLTVNDVDSGTTTAISLNYSPMWASSTTPVPYAYAAYAYINFMNQWLGEITSYVATITNTFSFNSANANVTGVAAGNPFTQSDIGRRVYYTAGTVYTFLGTILTVTTNTGAGTVMATFNANSTVTVTGQAIIFGNSSITIGGGTAFAITASTPISIMPYTTIDTSAKISTTSESIYKVGHELIGGNFYASTSSSGYLGTIAKIKSAYIARTGTISVALNGTTVTGVGTSFAATDVGRILYNSSGVLIGTIGAFTSTTSVTLVSGALVAVSPAAAFNISGNQIILSYMPYMGLGILSNPSVSAVTWTSIVYVSAKTLRGSQLSDYWGDVIGYVSAQSAAIMDTTTSVIFANIPSTILPNINQSIITTQQFTATTGVNYLTISTIAGATNMNIATNSTSGTVATDPNAHLLAGRPIYTNTATPVYVGTIKSATTSTAIVLEQGAKVFISSAAYKTTTMSLKYGIAPGDVIRHIDGRIIGQVKYVDIPNLRVYLTDNALLTYTGAVVIQHGIGLAQGIGKITSYNNSTKVVTGNRGATNPSLFSQFPLNYVNTNALASVSIRLFISLSGALTYIGSVTEITSDSSLTITSALSADLSGSYDWYYLMEYTSTYPAMPLDTYSLRNLVVQTTELPSIPWMAGLGVITGMVSYNTNSIGVITGNATFANPSTRFTEQVYPGVTVFIYSNVGVLAATGIVMKVTSNSSMTIRINYFNSAVYTTGALSGTFYWHYVTTPNESIATTSGDNAFISNDWQPLGKQNGYVNVIKTTANGDIFVGGQFTKWSDKSQSLRTPTTWRNVYNIAKLVVSVADDTVTEAYATPIVGTSYVRNGIAGTVNDLEDVSEINPINGYVGSGDKLIVGGNFYSTLNNETLLPSLGYIEGNTMNNSMRPIINTEIEPVNASSGLPSYVTKIAVTNRLRPYNGLVNTNVLDGINGSNIAVLFQDPVIANTKMRFTSVRVRGNASTYPVITIVNPTSSLKNVFSLYQTETGARLLFVNSKITLSPNERIVIDLRVGKRSIISNVRGNVISYLHPLSNFVDWILIGANSAAGVNTQSTDDYHLNVVGVHADYGITVTISYTPRFWSFDTNNMFFGTTKAGL
jgi:hypothetical protein